MTKCIFVSEGNVKRLIKGTVAKMGELGIHNEADLVLVGVMNGGMAVAKRLQEGGYKKSQVLPYNPHVKQPRMKEKDVVAIKGKNIVICEDNVITGKTLKDVIYFIACCSPNNITVVALACKNESEIIPNIYSIETENKDIILFPWKPLPLRIFNTKGFIIRSFDDKTIRENFHTNYTVLTKLGRNEVNYTLRAIGLDKKTLAGLVSFWFNNSELIIGYLDVLPGDLESMGEDISGMLMELILKYGHFHGKDIIVPAKESEKEEWGKLGFECTGKVFEFNDVQYYEMVLKEERPL